jgi:hypothetical protein
MKTKTILAAVVLALTPAIAFAECNYGKTAQTASCQAGTTWDAATSTCVTNPLG